MKTEQNNPSTSGWRRLLQLVEELVERVFQPRPDRVSLGIEVFGLAGLFVCGFLVWGYFFSWGNFSLDFLDWAEVFGPRFAILQDAARTGQFPLHVADTTAMRGVTDRYLAIADAPISPQFYLLRFMGIAPFLFWNAILLYAIGFAGLLLFYRRYRLSLWSFGLMFFLFFFNGHIVDHLAVGHVGWVGYFLLPFFLYLLFNLLEKPHVTWKWILGLSLTLLAFLLQGHFHLFTESIIFLVLIAIWNLRLVKPVLLGSFFAVLVSLPRLLPPALVVSKVTHPSLGGFASVGDLLGSLVLLRDPDRAFAVIPSDLYPLSWWEVDHFIGFLGAGLLLVFGVLLPLRINRSKQSLPVQVLVPALWMAALTVGQLYHVIVTLLPLPPFTGERVTSRFLVLPLMVVLVLATINLDRWVKARKFETWHFLVLLSASGIMVHDLLQHMRAWRIRYLDGLVYLFPKVPFDAARHVLANHADPLYVGLLIGGGLIALLALAFLVFKSLRESK